MAISIERSFIANVFISKTIRKLFTNYSAPYTSYGVSRHVNPRKEMDPYMKEEMIENPSMERKPLVYSHENISYAPSLLLAIFLFDIEAERRRIDEKRREGNFYYHSGTLYGQVRRIYTWFPKNMYKPHLKKEPRKAKYWRRHFQFFRSGLALIKPKQLITRIIQILKKRYPKWISKKHLKKRPFKRIDAIMKFVKTKYSPPWLINSYQIIPQKHIYRKFIKNIRIIGFLLRYLKYFNVQKYKKRLFFSNILLHSLTNLIYLLILNNNTKSKHKISHVLLRKIIHLQNSLFVLVTKAKSTYLHYNKKLFQARIFLFHLYAKIILFTIRKTAFIPNDRQMIIKFFALHNRNLNAHFLVNYICLRLGHYMKLNHIINPLIKRYKRTNIIKGFKFIISGRLTRKERAAYTVKSYKAMPLATANINIDYSFDFKILRFGVVGVKIYLLISEDIPYYYFFEFKNKI